MQPAVHERRTKTIAAAFSLCFALVLCTPVSAVGAGTPAVQLAGCQEQNAARLSEGFAAFRNGDTARAISLLQSVVDEEPTCLTKQYGSAAYWLGRAQEDEGRPDQQLASWETGMTALPGPQPPFSSRLAEAFFTEVFRQERGRYYPRAAQSYLHLLQQIGRPQSQEDLEILARQLRLLSEVIPPDLAMELGLHPELRRQDVQELPEDVGTRLVGWWEGQDPLPITFTNERLETHLQRVAEARTLYEKEGQLDDRGRIYVRLGAPYRKTTVRFNSRQFGENVTGSSMRFSPNDFRPGEFWVYDQVSRATQYLFVETEKNVFELGDAIDMLPTSLQHGFSSSRRGRQEAEAFVRSMAEIYRQLAVYHDRYHVQFQSLSNYLLDLDAGGAGSLARGNRRALDYARQARMTIQDADRFHDEERASQTPRVYTEEARTYDEIPVAVRTSRFLRKDGSTRVDVSWSAPFSGLIPRGTPQAIDQTYLLTGALVQRQATGEQINTRRFRSFIQPERNVDAFLTPQTSSFRIDPGSQIRIDGQWDQIEADTTASSTALGAQVGRRLYRSDTLRSLSNAPTRLLLSDVQPMVLPAGTKDETAVETAIPYPFDRVTPATPLAFYFEVYHLSFGSDDRTRFSVDYKVQRRTGDEYENLFDGGEWTSVAATSETASRTSREYVLIDLGAWEGKDAEQIRVTVRATDEHNAQSVQRSVDLTLFPTGSTGN